MTRDEFINSISDWTQLLSFCCRYRCDLCDDVYDVRDRDRKIKEDIASWFEDDTLFGIKDTLRKIPDDNIGWFRYDGDRRWSRLNDTGDFFDYKSRVLTWCDSVGLWDILSSLSSFAS